MNLRETAVDLLFVPNILRGMRPLIGISANFFHPDPKRPLFKNKRLAYFEQQLGEYFSVAGADVVGLVHPGRLESLSGVVSHLQGLVLAGGADVAPESYGETPRNSAWGGDAYQDAYEMELLQLAEERALPVLGICRGCQLLNVFAGGTLHQDLVSEGLVKKTHRDQDLYDRLMHEVTLEAGTRLANLYDVTRARVVSVHHQAVKRLGEGLRVAARSEDGIIEAVEAVDDSRFFVGVQWHPEWTQSESGSLDSGALVAAFLEAAAPTRKQGT